MAAILWKFKLFDVSLIWLQIHNLRPRISGMRLFWTLFIHFLTPIYYLPKFSILQVCSSDRLSVCLFVCNIHDTSHRSSNQHYTWHIYGTCIWLSVYTFWCWNVIDDIIRSKSRSNFEIAITPSIFKLQRCREWHGLSWSKTQLPVHFRFKRSPGPQNGSHFEIFEISQIFIWHQMWKDQKLTPKQYFWCWWRHWWRHSVTSKSPYKFMFKWICHIFNTGRR